MKCKLCKKELPDATGKLYCSSDKVCYKYYMAKRITDNRHQTVECAGQEKK